MVQYRAASGATAIRGPRLVWLRSDHSDLRPGEQPPPGTRNTRDLFSGQIIPHWQVVTLHFGVPLLSFAVKENPGVLPTQQLLLLLQTIIAVITQWTVALSAEVDDPAGGSPPVTRPRPEFGNNRFYDSPIKGLIKNV